MFNNENNIYQRKIETDVICYITYKLFCNKLKKNNYNPYKCIS